MGYQEYIYKIEDINKAKKNKEKIQNYLRKKNYGQNSLTLMRFDKELDQIEKGYHFYITGCRHYGRDLLFRLGEILGYNGNCIEEVYSSFSENKDNLADIFKNGKTKHGEVLESWSNDLECNIGKYELNDFALDEDNEYNMFLNYDNKEDMIITLEDGENIQTIIEPLLKDNIKTHSKVSMISVIDNKGFVIHTIYNYKNKHNLEFMNLKNAEPFTEEEIEEDGIGAFIYEALESFKVVNLAIFEQIDENKFILVK